MKNRQRVKTILYGILVAVDVVAWFGIAFSTLCIVNGGRWKMVLPLVVCVIAVWLCGELADAVDDRL